MKILSTFIIAMTIGLSLNLFASDEEVVDEKSIDQMLSSLKMEKIQAELMIEALAKRGRFDEEEVVKAKREVASVKEDDIEDIKTKALEHIISKKSYATK